MLEPLKGILIKIYLELLNYFPIERLINAPTNRTLDYTQLDF